MLNNNPREDVSLSGSQSAYKALNSATSCSSVGGAGAGAGVVVMLVMFGAGVVWLVEFGAAVVWFGAGVVVWLDVFGLGAGGGAGVGLEVVVVVPPSPQPDKVKAVRPVAPSAKIGRAHV